MPHRFAPVPRLRQGSHIRVIAPSSPFSAAELERGLGILRERYRVTHRPDLGERRGYLAGDDARRFVELEEALADPDVDAIVPVRGGYGATRLLRGLVPENVRAANKLLVGFSDITALHALWARAGLRSIHGPMVAALARAESVEVERWMAAVEGAPPEAIEGLRPLVGGVAEGPLLGGNLAVLAALVGTPHAPPIDGAILFLEDVGEAPYRVDRMLTTLHEAGWLARVAGVVLGSFTACTPRDDGVTVDEVLTERLSDLCVPVVAGLEAGHRRNNLELPLGASVRIDASAGALVFLEPAVV